jgi:SPP1 gp7 family putative phage head morphogenesis protein
VPVLNRRRQVEEVLARTAYEAARLPRDVLREFIPVLRQARAEAAHGLRAWLEEHALDGSSRYTAHKYRAVLAQLDVALEQVTNLETSLGDAMTRGGTAAVDLAGKHAIEQISSLSRIFGDAINPLPLSQAARIVGHAGSKTLIAQMPTSAARYAGQVGNDIRQQLAVGLVKGESMFQMQRRLVRHGGPVGEVALKGILGDKGAVSEYIAEGLFKRYEYWAERVVRTEVLETYNAGHLEALHGHAKDIDGLKQQWNGALDRRICVICRDLDGEIAAIGKEFPGGYSHPPAHPNCRCTLVAWHSDWK